MGPVVLALKTERGGAHLDTTKYYPGAGCKVLSPCWKMLVEDAAKRSPRTRSLAACSMVTLRIIFLILQKLWLVL